MELIEVKQYDERHYYGTDWVTEYKCKSDKKLTTLEAIAELEKLGKEVVGEISSEYNPETKELIVKAKMY